MPRTALLLLLSLPLGVAAHAADLTVDGTTVTLNGSLTYDNVRVINGGVITVTDYTGSGTTGTLSITAETITVDSSSAIIADGAGYRGVLNGNGEGPGGGVGGSSVADSGGGGGHGGPGGRGKDDSCSQNQGAGGSAYGSSTSTTVDMGSAGGAAGSADGDSGGRGAAGGGAIQLTAQTITIAGTIRTNGDSGGVINNDAAGGGAGGGIVLQADVLACTGSLIANGGNGGATDDAGGGGGGGVINQFYDASGTTCTATVSAGTSSSCGGTSGSSGATGAAELDWDGDGYTASDGDCDTDDASVFPGATEYCDGVDNDCDGTTDESDAVDAVTYYVDSDGDGYGSVTDAGADACSAPSGSVADNTDCDDTTAAVNPGATEVCDGIDNDCDGLTDDDGAANVSTWYRDGDSDGYGDPATSDIDCNQPSGFVADDGDCDDGDAAVNPAATEVCDGIDNDCDGLTDDDSAIDVSTWHRDADADGYGDPLTTDIDCNQPSGYVSDSTDCDDGDAAVNPAATEIWYDGIDQDCSGGSDYDQDGDGQDAVAYGGIDCDDTDASIYEGAEDAWYDGVDSDCAGNSDYDADYDGYDSASYGGDDCDDADPDTYPGAPDEPYDGVINDCDDSDEYDADGDGYSSAEYGGDDCDDANSDINPGADETWYDGVDDDCDDNDDDQDGDGVPVDEDCDDTDPTVTDDCGDDDTGGGQVDDAPNVDTGGLTVGDGAYGSGVYVGGACAGSAGAKGGAAATLFLGLLGLAGWRRREER